MIVLLLSHGVQELQKIAEKLQKNRVEASDLENKQMC